MENKAQRTNYLIGSNRGLVSGAVLVVCLMVALGCSFGPSSIAASVISAAGVDGRPVEPASAGKFNSDSNLALFGSGNADFDYHPAVLKLCSVAGFGVSVGTPFTYVIAPADPETTLPYPTGPVTVPTGSCAFVNGPYPADPAFPGVGTFNYGTSIVVTENRVAWATVSRITSSTLLGTVPTGTLAADIPHGRGTLTLNQPVVPNNNFNEITFVLYSESPPTFYPARFDFDGDHVSDIVLFRPSDGNWYYSPSSTGSAARGVHFGEAGDIPIAADYDGDSVTDQAVYRNGQWYVLGSTAGFSSANFGLATDIPQTGDFDGDTKADFAVYRPSNGTWYIMGSSTGFKAVKFGISTDIPVAADFDGDGKTDPAVYRNGTWYTNASNDGFSAYNFGIAGDVPVKADYDGDGRTDVAVYRGGTWYFMNTTAGFSAVKFGIATDTPVPADYDGDGKTDVAVYRSSTTNWYILNSSQSGNAVGGFNSMQFGSAGDVLMNY